jgi:hypothetical protein
MAAWAIDLGAAVFGCGFNTLLAVGAGEFEFVHSAIYSGLSAAGEMSGVVLCAQCG